MSSRRTSRNCCCRRTRSSTSSPPSITNSKIDFTQLTAKQYLSEPEQLEEVNLKKRKLQLKDRMENILRQRRG